MKHKMDSPIDRGSLFVLSAPSGAGKTTLLSMLVRDDPDIAYSISHTTRKPRLGEREGEAYYFVDEAVFNDLIKRQAFLEWARVHDHLYGTSKRAVLENLEMGRDIVLDLDVEGAALIKRQIPDAITIFILPPDYETLKQRLIDRAKDSPEVIRKRLENARSEIARIDDFDYVLINGDLDKCYRQLRAIVEANRLRRRANKARIGKVVASFAEKG